MIVVTGATGNVGRPLVETLTAAGEEVRAVSRRGPLAGDLSDASSLRPAFEGASAVFLLLPGDFRGPLEPVLSLAAGARVVLLSSQGVGTGRHPAVFEDAVRASGPGWTILRPAGFASNALQWAESVRASRTLAAPFEDVALPVIDPADIAAVAAAVLTDDSHAGRTYELTGPAPVSPRDQAAAIGEAVGEPVRFVPQTRAEALSGLLSFMPREIADSTLDILGAPVPSERRVSPDVERVLGRPPRPFAEWAARNAVAFK
ncbi:NAD(P)H-binding protein [Amycolatopsis sp. OK19-0408]|uniref:NAD(P)H-binding protein n=1 Tax=Amycolatopsis iheyensis TaxID=2945988 RepID=A0A9X2N7L7_9PSEU|nr:NAD(P)H-binding protein [Amycolatopsis iheyensis]MCR6483449.1 NAD(P)H-binding protein [Amycolatopsis iheyensis]